MGKRIIAQRRGKGSRTYRVPSRAFRPSLEYKNLNGKVIDIVNDPLRFAPLAKIEYEDKSRGWIVAPEGICVGDSIEGMILPLSKIGLGSQIFAIETRPNSGPRLCRSSGSGAILFSKGRKVCIINLPSRKKKRLSPDCRATIGRPAGGGRTEKPWVKAGKKWIAMHAKGKLYPRTSGVAMNVVDHPFGSGRGRHIGNPKSVSRHAPPGRKVGALSSRRTGKKKR